MNVLLELTTVTRHRRRVSISKEHTRAVVYRASTVLLAADPAAVASLTQMYHVVSHRPMAIHNTGE